MSPFIRNLINSLVSILMLYGCCPSACAQTRAIVATPAANGVDGTVLWPSQVITAPSLTLTGSFNPLSFTFLPDGTVAAPSLSFANSTGMGLYRVGADSIGIGTNQLNRVTINNSGLVIGAGTAINAVFSTTNAWDPPSIADGASATRASVTLTGATVGDNVIASHTSIISSLWKVQAVVVSANTVDVTITNNTGGTVDLATGTLRITSFKF